MIWAGWYCAQLGDMANSGLSSFFDLLNPHIGWSFPVNIMWIFPILGGWMMFNGHFCWSHLVIFSVLVFGRPNYRTCIWHPFWTGHYAWQHHRLDHHACDGRHLIVRLLGHQQSRNVGSTEEGWGKRRALGTPLGMHWAVRRVSLSPWKGSDPMLGMYIVHDIVHDLGK